MPDELGTPKDVAAHLRRTEKTLANWRSLDIGPPYLKVHGHILYDWRDVRAWLGRQKIDPGLMDSRTA